MAMLCRPTPQQLHFLTTSLYGGTHLSPFCLLQHDICSRFTFDFFPRKWVSPTAIEYYPLENQVSASDYRCGCLAGEGAVMGRPRQKRAPQERFGKTGSKNRSRVPSKNAHVTSTEEFDDDIDKFHKGADKIALDVDEDTDLEEGDIEEPVFDLKAEGSSDADEESDNDELDEEQLSGLAAKMAKQAKILRQKTSLMEDDDEDEADDDEQGIGDKRAAWGRHKKTYYDADTVDYELLSSDEEVPAEEEAEALRLQRQMAEKLRPEDFDLDLDEEENSAKEYESSLQDVVAKAEAKENQRSKSYLSKRGRLDVSAKDASILVEEVKKDVSALSKEEQMNVVMSDAPELVGLLTELKESSNELRNKIEPLLLKVKECNNGNKGGLHYLQTKRMLLLSYIQNILFYLLMKAEGRSVRDHPVIARLVEIRTLLLKMQPLEEKLQSQVDEVLTSLEDVLPPSEVKACESPKVCAQLPSIPSREEEDLQAPNVTEGKVPEDRPHEQTGQQKRAITKLLDTNMQIPANTLQQGKPLAVVQSDDDEALPNNISLQKIISSKIQKRKPVISGDMDLPLKEDLGIRRAKLERQKVPYLDDNDNSDEQGDALEDEFYREAKRLKVLKKAAKEKDPMKMTVPEPIVEEDIGKRHITYQMEKNKGLTPHRKKLTKNPRKKYKLKHQKAVIRRKGQVREIQRPSAPYGGEATGIRTTISRSVRFHN
ncbi:hypothetical protein GOP47_0027274 [Adiantum capillus-veneris]|nr:hypothetical protein GOP47_0027274 [Adiantum capillus-veneris]